MQRQKHNKNDLNEKMQILWVIFQLLFFDFCVLSLKEIEVLAVSLDLTLSPVFFFLKGNFTTKFYILLQIL